MLKTNVYNGLLLKAEFLEPVFKKLFCFAVLIFLLINITTSSYAQNNEELVVLHTQSGKIVIEFFPNDAPKTVENFLKLTNDGFYDDIIFHRIIKGFMIQGGDPLSKQAEYQNRWGTGDAGYNIQAEFNTIKHNRGIVSMARSVDLNSASSQFFIVHENSNFLDQQYTVFGRIITQESFDTLDRIASLETGDRDIPIDTEQAKIINAEVKQKSEIPDLLELGEPERVLSSDVTFFDGPYIDEKLGISFITPQNWQIQQLEKTSPGAPDVIIIGPKSAEISPVISVNVIDTDGKSLTQRLVETRASLQPSIDAGTLEIIYEELTTIEGNQANLREALGTLQSEEGNMINVRFIEALISTPEKFYTITYTNDENDFENHLKNLEIALNSFKILSEKQESNEVKTEGNGCLIATATFGSELAPQVQQLREIRDNTLLETKSGSAFMSSFNQFYYSFSPTIADWERVNPVFKEAVKFVITPLLTSLSILNHVDINSEEAVLVYGIGIILMNIGMYFVFPTLAIIQLKKRF